MSVVQALKDAQFHLPHGLYSYLRIQSPIVLIHPFTAQHVNQRFRARVEHRIESAVVGKQDSAVADLDGIAANCLQKNCLQKDRTLAPVPTWSS